METTDLFHIITYKYKRLSENNANTSVGVSFKNAFTYICYVFPISCVQCIFYYAICCILTLLLKTSSTFRCENDTMLE